jgi:dipeptidase E
VDSPGAANLAPMRRNIVACGGGGWSSDTGGDDSVEEHILGLARRDLPRVMLLPTASGDSDWLIARFYERIGSRPCRPDHLALFRPHPDRVAERLLGQDVIYVGGGSTANLLAVWAVHEMAPLLRRAWEGGTVLAGVSAGAICWFAAGLTNSLGRGFAPVVGLGLLEGGFCPHADTDPARLVALRDLVDRGAMPPTLAVDDDAAVHVADGAPPRVVSAAPGRGARLFAPGGVEEGLPSAPVAA